LSEIFGAEKKFMGRANNSQADSGNAAGGGGLVSLFTGLVLGLMGGVTLALLTAPKSGSETRDVIQRSAKDVPERLGEVVDDSLDLYASFLNYCQMNVEEQGMRLRRALAAGKLAAAKKREEIEIGG
jgi:gas vesicle protein